MYEKENPFCSGRVNKVIFVSNYTTPQPFVDILGLTLEAIDWREAISNQVQQI